MKKIKIYFTLIICIFICNICNSQTTIYSQNFGIPPLPLSGFPTGWSSTGATSGWVMSSSTPSSGYTGASGGYNVKSGTVAATLNFSSVSTIGYTNISILWGARKPGAAIAYPAFQWSSDSITWHTVAYANTVTSNTWQLVNGGAFINLPAGAAGVSALRLRWTISVVGTSANPYRIDDVVIKGIPLSTLFPAKLAILSVNNGLIPDSCHSFNVVVQTEDSLGVASNVSTATPVILSKLTGNGSGLLISTTDTIHTGHYIDTISVSYSNSETGVSILASSPLLTSDTSNVFIVKACIAKLPTCFAWDTSGGVTLPYPGGWYSYGLGVFLTGYFAPNSGNFNTQGDSLVIHYDTIAGSLNYWLGGNNLAGSYMFDVFESPNGLNYTSLSSDTVIGNSWALHTDTPLTTSRFIKFVYTQKTVGNIAIDDICIFLPASQPAKLKILSVNNDLNPDSCHAFNVVVQSQDYTGAPANVTIPQIVSLSKLTGSGTGILSGGSGTIQANSNIDTITVNYSRVETGVSILASGPSLTSDTSILFNVLPCIPLVPAALPTCYEWQHTGSNLVPYPTGWYNYGLTSSNATGYAVPYCGAFVLQNDSLLIYFNNPPDSVVFWLRANALTGAYVFDVEESAPNHVYSNISTFNTTNPIVNTWTHHAFTLNNSSRYVKFVYSTRYTGNILIDSVCIYPFIAPPVAAKLKIASVNTGSNPDSCTVFNVVVQSQDTNNIVTNVLTDTKISLTVNTGSLTALGGILSDTIHAGTNTIILPVTYSAVQTNVSLIALRNSGDILTPDTSIFFDVEPCLTNIKSNFSEKEITIYPNPVNDILFINNISNIENIKITNIFGQDIKIINNLNTNYLEISLKSLPDGIYVIIFKNRNGNFSKLTFVRQLK